MSELSDYIDEQAQKPQGSAVDGQSIQRRSLRELHEHEDRELARAATASPAASFRNMVSKLVPPGGVR
jgi:hypothetical protein